VLPSKTPLQKLCSVFYIIRAHSKMLQERSHTVTARRPESSLLYLYLSFTHHQEIGPTSTQSVNSGFRGDFSAIRETRLTW